MSRKKAPAKKQKPKAQSNKSKVKFSLIKAPFTQQQLQTLLQKTPTEHVYHRPAKGGGEWKYVTGAYVKQVLNYLFGFLWDFEIKEHGREGDLVWVQGRLTIKDTKGNSIVKEQFGRAEVKFKRGAKTPLDFGNDLKAAATDALKKCASEIGIASDIYAGNEFAQIQKQDKGFVPPQNGKVIEIKPGPDADKKINELKKMLKGKTDDEKKANLKKRAGIILRDFSITAKHASILIATLLNAETKKK